MLENTRALLAPLLAGYPAEQLSRHPGGDPARWSAQQVAEHLASTWRLTTSGIEDRLRKGRPLQTRPTVWQRAGQIAVCYGGYFPERQKAPAALLPPQDASPADGDMLLAECTEALAAMDAALGRIQAQARGRFVLTHHRFGPMSVARWRRFHRAHTRHHLPQLERALRGDPATAPSP